MASGYKSYDVYRRSYVIALEIHKVSLTFPKIEQFALADQIRRAAMSIPMNFAEGYGKRRSEAEFKRYLMMAVGSCDEVRVQVDFSKDLGYISESDHSKFSQEYDEIGKMLNSLWQNWRTLNA